MIRVRVYAALAVCLLSYAAGALYAEAAGPARHDQSATSIAASADCGVWHAFGGIGDGCAGSITSSAIASNGDLYVGGSFLICGDVPATSIARWDGTRWHALGGGVGNTVQAIAISGNDVYVGGQLGSAGGAPVSGVARWDGSQWSALGDGISGSTGYYEVHALAIAGDDLYVGGIFDRAGGAPANSIARWNTSSHTWSALGSGIVRSAQAGTVNALAYGAGTLYAGGTFDHAGGGTARNVAVWDGNAWLPLGAGIVGEVDALANWNGALYAGGRLQSSNAVPLHNLARWTGSAWVDVGGGTLGDVTALTGTLAGLFVGGGFDTAGGNAHANLAIWNGSAWSDVGGGIDAPVVFNVVHSIAAGVSSLFVTGEFSSVGGGAVSAHFVAAWNGSAWSNLPAPAGDGLYSFVQVGAAVDYGGLPCFGGLSELRPEASSIACWTGSTWTPLGGDIANNLPLWVDAMLVSGTDLYVGGYFNLGNGCCVGRWDGVAWNAIGDGIQTEPITIAVDGDHVYAAGYFNEAGGVPANHVAMWDGNAWQPLGDGIDTPPNALAVYGGKLYAGGYFSDAGGVAASYIAAWDGNAWAPVGDGLDGQVNALAVHAGSLYAGGSFSQAGILAANSIARWNGTQWSAVETPSGNGVTYQGFPGYVATLAETNLGLFVGGFFDAAAGTPANQVTRLDADGFHTLGANPLDGIDANGYVTAITLHGNDVYVGGVFGIAHGRPSANIARYDSDGIFAHGFEAGP